MVVRYFNGLGLMERFVMNIMNNNFTYVISRKYINFLKLIVLYACFNVQQHKEKANKDFPNIKFDKKKKTSCLNVRNLPT